MRLTWFYVFIVLMAGSSAATVEPVIEVQDSQPVIASPGDTVKLFIKVENKGTTQASFPGVDVETAEGISYTGTTSDLGEEFRLCGGCRTVGTLYFKVEEDAYSGTYPVDIGLSSGGTGVVKKYEFEVDGEPRLNVESSGTESAPGKKSNITFNVENVGTDTATDITLTPSSDRMSFRPSTATIESLGPGQEEELDLVLKTDEDIGSGVKSFELETVYMDESEQLETGFDLKMDVSEETELVLGDLNAEDAVLGSKTSVIVELENIGPGEAEAISSEIECEEAEVLSGKSYVGQLDDGESVPMTFEVIPRQRTSACTVKTGYSDSSRKTFSADVSFSAEKGSSRLPVFAGIAGLLVLAGLFYWRKRGRDELEEI